MLIMLVTGQDMKLQECSKERMCHLPKQATSYLNVSDSQTDRQTDGREMMSVCQPACTGDICTHKQ